MSSAANPSRGEDGFLNEVTFTSSITDMSTGLQYMNSRFYEPTTGRFVSQDSYSGNVYEPWTQHLYSYTGNNPTNFVDPTGHRRVENGNGREAKDDWRNHGRDAVVPPREPSGFPWPEVEWEKRVKGMLDLYFYGCLGDYNGSFQTQHTIAVLRFLEGKAPISFYWLINKLEEGRGDATIWASASVITLDNKFCERADDANETIQTGAKVVDVGLTLWGYYVMAGSNPTTTTIMNDMVKGEYQPGLEDIENCGIGGWFIRGFTGKTKTGKTIEEITRLQLSVSTYGTNTYMGNSFKTAEYNITLEYDNVIDEWLYASVNYDVYYDNYGRKIGR